MVYLVIGITLITIIVILRRKTPTAHPSASSKANIGCILSQHGDLNYHDVLTDLGLRLKRLPNDSRKAFALACAEHLMRTHEALPTEKQLTYTLSWRPVLDEMWKGLSEGSPANPLIQQAIAKGRRLIETDQATEENPDDDAAAASFMAAECYVKGDVENAVWAANRVIDYFDVVVQYMLGIEGFTDDDETSIQTHPVFQQQLRLLIEYATLLETVGVTPEIFTRLHTDMMEDQ